MRWTGARIWSLQGSTPLRIVGTFRPNGLGLSLGVEKERLVYEDRAGYVFLFLIIGGHITAYLFWYFFARDFYGGTSKPEARAMASSTADEVSADAAATSG